MPILNQNFLNDAEPLLAEVEQLLLGVDLACRNESGSSGDSIIADKVMQSYVRMTEITQILENLLSEVHKSNIKFNLQFDSLVEATDELRVEMAVQFQLQQYFNSSRRS